MGLDEHPPGAVLLAAVTAELGGDSVLARNVIMGLQLDSPRRSIVEVDISAGALQSSHIVTMTAIRTIVQLVGTVAEQAGEDPADVWATIAAAYNYPENGE